MSQIDKFNNNCTLVAVREFSDATEDQILAAFRANDFIANRGMYHHKWIKAATDLGLRVSKLSYQQINGMTVAAFCKKFNEGDFFVTISGHALNIRDGRVIDTNTGGKARARVRTAELVHNAKPAESGERFVMERFPGWSKSAAKNRRRDAYHWAAEYSRNNDRRLPTADEVVSNTSYSKADLNWDVKRGFVTLTNRLWQK